MEIDAHYISAALTAVVVPIVLGWLLRGVSSTARRVDGVVWLTYSKGMKGFSLFFALIVLALIVLWFNVETKDKAPVAWMVVLFGGLTLPLLLESFFVRIGYNAEKIYCHSIWRHNRVIDWAEVESVAFSQSMNWWVIDTRGSGKIRVSQFVSGLPELLLELEERGVKQNK